MKGLTKLTDASFSSRCEGESENFKTSKSGHMKGSTGHTLYQQVNQNGQSPGESRGFADICLDVKVPCCEPKASFWVDSETGNPMNVFVIGGGGEGLRALLKPHRDRYVASQSGWYNALQKLTNCSGAYALQSSVREVERRRSCRVDGSNDEKIGSDGGSRASEEMKI
ncbi:hypothetical protein RF11_10299 [Thelohanellus kitauei]|uniref:Uncharacterized protein n=1 Tax=Thelohanellus kitauei TaxID=669202 RepID=A0A0C2MKB1_THEKT|nr:hypothetical protein RF11_10299 [Thelohanellus kitauei]